MTDAKKDFCFCTLALGNKYCEYAGLLASELEKFSPGTMFVIGTDSPGYFKDHSNVVAFKHKQQSIFGCLNDRRFVILKAISLFRVAIHIDADTRVNSNIPEDIEWKPGITSCRRNINIHINECDPYIEEPIKKVAGRFNISLDNAGWIGESLYIVARDGGKEKEFIKWWGIICNYLQLRKLNTGSDGYMMGLAAAKVGWSVNTEGWEKLRNVTKHLDASLEKGLLPSPWQSFKLRLGYHYRLHKGRLIALKDFNLYYR